MTILVAITIAVITAIATSFFTHIGLYFKEKKLSQKQLRLNLIGEIMGNLQFLRQLYTLRYECEISLEYYDYLIKNFSPGNALYLAEMRRLIKDLQNFTFELAKCRKEYFSNIEKVPLIFSIDSKITQKIKDIIHQRAIEISKPPAKLTESQLIKFKEKSIQVLHNLVHQHIYMPCRELYELLKKQATY